MGDAVREAVAAMKERKASPLLVRHLLDPATPPADLERVAAALATLAGPAELSALKTFFAMYRGVEDDATSPAVARVAEALLRLGAADVVTRAAADPWTTPALRERIAALVRSAPSAALCEKRRLPRVMRAEAKREPAICGPVQACGPSKVGSRVPLSAIAVGIGVVVCIVSSPRCVRPRAVGLTRRVAAACPHRIARSHSRNSRSRARSVSSARRPKWRAAARSSRTTSTTRKASRWRSAATSS